MAGENNPATPPAASGGLTGEQVKEIVAAAIGEAIKPLADNQRIFADTLAKLPPATAAATTQQPAAAAAAAGGADKPLTLQQVQELLDRRDQKQQQDSRVTQARSTYIAEQLKGLPAAYQNLIPLSDDPAKLAEAGKAARAQFEADFKVAGGEKPNVSGNSGGGQSPAAAVDTSKLSPVAKLELGLKAGDGKSGSDTAAAGAAAAPAAAIPVR